MDGPFFQDILSILIYFDEPFINFFDGFWSQDLACWTLPMSLADGALSLLNGPGHGCGRVAVGGFFFFGATWNLLIFNFYASLGFDLGLDFGCFIVFRAIFLASWTTKRAPLICEHFKKSRFFFIFDCLRSLTFLQTWVKVTSASVSVPPEVSASLLAPRWWASWSSWDDNAASMEGTMKPLGIGCKNTGNKWIFVGAGNGCFCWALNFLTIANFSSCCDKVTGILLKSGVSPHFSHVPSRLSCQWLELIPKPLQGKAKLSGNDLGVEPFGRVLFQKKTG